ncbi:MULTISPECIES: hypothetical protein [Rhizobium]|uniref:hypothetical protein n=1 Tax=Rhizobium TaxID=379 RepID=UPI00102FBA9B|nr:MULTISPECIES: hypothetical protein [Rhizobium]MBY5826312.1 hypothetical protein [Rhizobium leguminosarum]TBA44976.1 hypothetical protein ELH62_22530 [Rhizobium ruizarguesonis]
MTISTTTFEGLTFNVLVEEFHDQDASGRLNGYLASVYKQDKHTSVRHLIRKSRLPGAADDMKREIQRDGIQAFRRLSLA